MDADSRMSSVFGLKEVPKIVIVLFEMFPSSNSTSFE